MRNMVDEALAAARSALDRLYYEPARAAPTRK